MRDERGLIEAFLADGYLPLSMTGFILLLSGWFAIFQSWTGYFLPQDVHALGFDARQLAGMANIRVVHFMFHDRVAFGGTLLAIGCAYWFLAEFPLRARQPWAWWTFLVSGICGFASFLTYLGYGYLDTWHGIATLFLLPLFAAGLWRARPATLQVRDLWQVRPTNEPRPLGSGLPGGRDFDCRGNHYGNRDDARFRASGSSVHAHDVFGPEQRFSPTSAGDRT